MNTLPLNKCQYLSTHLDPILNKRYDKLTVGSLIFRSSSNLPQILLLKRATHERHYPNVFEIPGGNVEETDATIEGALRREVLEETGLQIKKVLDAVHPFDYTLEKRTGGTSVWKTTVQLNFICEVNVSGVQVNFEEHSEAQWIGVDTLQEIDVTKDMRKVILEGFAWVENRS